MQDMWKTIEPNGAGVLETGDQGAAGKGQAATEGNGADPLEDMRGTREDWYAHLASVNLHIVQLRAAIADQAHRVEQIDGEGPMLDIAVEVLVTLQIAMRAYLHWRQHLLAMLARLPLVRTQAEIEYLIAMTEKKEVV